MTLCIYILELMLSLFFVGFFKSDFPVSLNMLPFIGSSS